MFTLILVLLFFQQINASEDEVISVDGLLDVIDGQLKGNYGHKVPTFPIDLYQQDLLVTYLHDGKGNANFQLVHDPDHILMISENEFKPGDDKNTNRIKMCKAEGGTREVGLCAIDGKKRYCFKQWPEAPGMERAAYKLYQVLFSGNVPMPRSIVIVINDQVFLVSEFIEGVQLEHFLAKDMGIINTESLQKLAIYTMLSNPEDCRLQNCLVRKMQDREEYELALFDNERSFGSDIVSAEDGAIETRVHSVVFGFLEYLRKETCESIIDDITTNERAVHRMTPLIDMLAESSYHNQLSKMLPDISKPGRETFLGIPSTKEFVGGIVDRYVRIIVLGLWNRKTIARIFEEQLANLYGFYNVEIASDDSDNIKALKRIQQVDRGRCDLHKAPTSSFIPLKRFLPSTDTPTIEDFSEVVSSKTHQYRAHLVPVAVLGLNILAEVAKRDSLNELLKLRESFADKGLQDLLQTKVGSSVNPRVVVETGLKLMPKLKFSAADFFRLVRDAGLLQDLLIPTPSAASYLTELPPD